MIGRRKPGLAAAFLMALCLNSIELRAQDQEPVRFNEQIRPLLSDRCLYCHGPDDKHREANLRLDLREAAVDELHAIIPGSPEESPLWKRITSTDPDLQMPPPSSKKPRFSLEELELIRRWIAEGAPFEGHWAFLPLKREAPPQVDGASHPIDAFILNRLLKDGLTPSPEADRATLIRRVALDLTGLLPTPQQVEEFADDDRPDAYERLVDRLLASPQYGERWGRHWLDQARYADSNGYSIDGPRDMWPYRDWVISALNRDLPFDQFTIEQLAGDLLPNPDKNQLVATGFHRNTLINQEGGTDKEQFRVEATMDRVNTTGAVWLGLTVGCAQCHTHKFDPIPQQEYYRLLAFFNSAEDANDRGPTEDVFEGEVFGLPKPEPVVPKSPSADEVRDLRLAWEQKTLDELKGKLSGESTTTESPWRQFEVGEAKTKMALKFDKLPDGSWLAPRDTLPNDVYTLTGGTNVPSVAAVRVRVLTDDSLPQRGPGRASNGNFVLSNFQLSVYGVKQPFRSAAADHEQPGYPVSATIDNDPKTGWAINVGDGMPGQMNADHEAVFILKSPVEAVGKALQFEFSHELNEHYLIGRLAIDVSPTADVAPTGRREQLFAALNKPEQERTESDKAIVEFAFLEAEPRARPPEIKKPEPAKTMVMRDLAQQRETFLLTRGDFTRPDKELGPLTPGVISAIAPQLPEFRNRLDLARWLVHPDNPLTPRVTVNRVWMRFFGRGLVETEEDFGAQGAPPTHPALLDWLSSEFQRRGWSQKSLHRLIVTSATYKQSSRHRTDLQEKDARNLLLARQERFRLEAEVVRDAALSASGLLQQTVGGPSVNPPQPDGVYAFTQVNKTWTTSEGAQRFRRGLYTFFYRSAPYPLFTTFDTPDFQAVCTRRLRSNTPLQALTLANDPAFLELAQGLALRLATEIPGSFTDTLDARLRLASTLCFSREPTPSEWEVLSQFLQQQHTQFSADAESAKSLTTPALDGVVKPSDGAALVLLARTLFNTDNFITRE